MLKKTPRRTKDARGDPKENPGSPYLLGGEVLGHEEEEVSDEEADAELQVEGDTDAPERAAQDEGDNGEEEAEQRYRQPHVGHHVQRIVLMHLQ